MASEGSTMLKQLAIGLTILSVHVMACRAAAPTTDPVGDPAMAERFAQMAQNNLAGRNIGEITLREAAALLEGACKLNPNDPRLAHLRAEACLAVRDIDGAIEAPKLAASLDGN